MKRNEDARGVANIIIFRVRANLQIIIVYG